MRSDKMKICLRFLSVIPLSFFVVPYSLFAQLSRSSRVILHVDKNICYAGDTIRFSSYSFRDKETNLYVDLYADDSVFVARSIFPIVDNKAIGSIVMPKEYGYYWLRGYTYNSQVCIIPVAVLDDSIKTFANRRLPATPAGKLAALKVTLTDEGDSLAIKVADSLACPLSLSVTDAHLPGPSYTLLPSDAKFEQADADYLSFTGTVRKSNRKQHVVADKEIVFVFQQDSATTRVLTVPVDSAGTFKISGLTFHDTASLNYQINVIDGDIPNVFISFKPKEYPLFVPPAGFLTDTISYAPHFLAAPDFKDRAGYLKTVVVKVRWADRNKALDHRYVKNQIFSWPSHFNFDMRDTNATRYTYDLGDYLTRNLPFFLHRGGFKGYELYLDEFPTDIEYLSALNVKTDIAYVKEIDDAGSSKPILAIYRRDAIDLRPVPGKMNKIPILGYATPAPFTQADRITSLWIPDQKGNSFKIRKLSGRLVIEGLNYKGQVFHYETIVK